MSGSLILALDTATERLSVAVLGETRGESTGFTVLGRADETAGRDTSRLLLTVAERALSDAGGTVPDLGALVVGVGPGTFTGIRVAVAAARAIGLALDIPVLGVSTLAAVAAEALRGGLGAEVETLASVVDARRGQVFVGLYERDAANLWVRRTPYRALPPEVLLGEMRAGGDPRKSALAGDGRTLGLIAVETEAAGEGGGSPTFYGAALVETPVSAGSLVEGQESLMEPGDGPVGRRLAPWVGMMLRGGWDRRTPEDRVPGKPGTPEAVVPLYVRAPDADEHITRMRDPFGS